MKVSDAMTPNVQLCTPQDTLKDAAEAMMAWKTSSPICSSARLK
jgi:hypothetical protein